MKTFFRKLFNLRTDLELVSLLIENYTEGYICESLDLGDFDKILSRKERVRLRKMVREHLGDAYTASQWCLNKELVVDYPNFFNSEEFRLCRRLFLQSLWLSKGG